MKRSIVRQSVCLFRRSTAAAACSGFATKRQEISIDSGRRRRPAAMVPQYGVQQQMRAVLR